MYFEIFLIGILAGMSPGPDFFVVMRNSLGYGKRVGITTALGISLALIIHVTYTILGFSLIIQSYPQIFFGIQVLGALYLIWLGVNAIRSVPSSNDSAGNDDEVQCGTKTGYQGFIDGFICNILNPKASLFFLGIFSQFLGPEVTSLIKWVYGLEIVCSVGIWFITLSIIINSQHIRSFYQNKQHYIDKILGLVLLYLGLRIVFSNFI